MSALDDFKRFVADAESGTQYAKWAQQNPGELTRWAAFRDALLAGQKPTPPAMTSAHGRELIDGGVMAEHYQALEAPAPAPAPTPTPAPSPPPPVTPPTPLPKQGLNVGFVIFGRTSANQDRDLDACADLANGKPCWIRLDWWPDTTSDTRWDAIATKARARGLTMMGLYNADYTNRPTEAAYAANCGALAKKCDLVNTINEPDMSGWPPAVLAEYLVAAYAAVHAANPNALVIGPSIWKGPAQQVSSMVPYVQAILAQANGRPMWDVFDVHLYGDPATVDPNWNSWDWTFRNGGNNLKALVGTTPIMCTEAGDSAAKNGETMQANAVAHGMDARASLGLASFGAYALSDDASPGGFGLRRTDWTSRPAYGSFKTRTL